MTLKALVNLLAVLATITSAALWFWAAKVPLDPKLFAVYGGLPAEAQQQFTKQVRLNGYAALATGISGVFQAISFML